MKILLITLPRTGSTSLLKKISEEQKLYPISEPFNDVNGNLEKYKDYNWKNTNNMCVKTHINHKNITFYLEFIKYFDEVILLSRKDLMACAESLSYANYFQNFTKKYEWINTPNLNENIKLVKKFNEDLKKLSELINIDILYYEDLFDMNSENKLRKMILKEKILFSKEECDRIINNIEKLETFKWQKSDRKYTSSQIYKSNETIWIFNKLKDYFENETNNKLLDNIERIHFHKFTINDFFNIHNDLRDERLFSIGVILNDEYEGGEFVLYGDEKILINKTIGNCYIFDAGIQHEILEVINGTRYTIIVFIKKDNIIFKKYKNI